MIPIEQRVEQFKLFHKRQNSRPLLGFFTGGEYPLFESEAFDRLG